MVGINGVEEVPDATEIDLQREVKGKMFYGDFVASYETLRTVLTISLWS